MNVVSVQGLRIAFGDQVVVDDVGFVVDAGECVAIVGESGAGKTLTVAALAGLLPSSATVSATQLQVGGVDLSSAGRRQWQRVRGRRVGFVPQDALNALDPLRRIAREVAEPIEVHHTVPRDQRAARVLALIRDVAIPEPSRRARQYPHELSGGLRQRALIASAIAVSPNLLIADEPTTALDSTVQRQVLALLRGLVDVQRGLLVVSHDLGAVTRLADRVLVMREGVIVEQGTTAEVLGAPKHPYTRELLQASRPRSPRSATQPESAPVLIARQLGKSFDGAVAVRAVSMQVSAGRTIAIVGESGAGKTTLVRLLLAAIRPDSGEVTLDGAPWTGIPEPARRERRGRIQYVSQNPHAAFNPRWSIGRSLRQALSASGVARGDRAARVTELLPQVELDPALAARRIGELSGGQRQRAAIARALATNPAILILDEPLSALDVSVGARIIALLQRLQRERLLAIVLVTHDLRVVSELADNVLVMQRGTVVEAGATATVFTYPRHPFTIELLDAAGLNGVG